MEDESNRDQLIRVSEENLWHGRFVEAEKVNDQLRRELATEKVLAEQLSEHAKSKVGDTVTEELFNDLWHIAHPDDERWEYPAQIFREVRDFADQLRRELDQVAHECHCANDIQGEAIDLLAVWGPEVPAGRYQGKLDKFFEWRSERIVKKFDERPPDTIYKLYEEAKRERNEAVELLRASMGSLAGSRHRDVRVFLESLPGGEGR